jgi:hypothetical protein
MTRLLLLLLALAFPVWVHAQQATPAQQTQPNTCPMIVQTAITLTNQRCEPTGLNQICYGHLVLDAQPRPGLADFGFNEPGDIVDVIEVQSLRLSALDTETGRWGVVRMQIEANLAESADAPPEVQILLFGDAELNDASQFLPGQARQAAVVREQPSVDSRALTSLDAGGDITANGRLPDNSWLRINLARSNGWIRADLVDLAGDIETLSAITAENQAANEVLAQFGPMQAFYFRSGTDDAPCAEAPNSGLLIQTPEGVASISIWLDEVVIQLDATAFIQAQPDGNLVINVLDGTAQVSAQGDTRTLVSGMQITVPLDENLAASAVPDDPAPFNPSALQSLPLALLDRPIEIPAPRIQPAGVPIAGQWRFSWDVAALTCPDGTTVPFESTGAASSVRVTGEVLDWNQARYVQSTPGVYRSSYADSSGNLHQDTLQVVAPDRIIGEKILDLVNPVCTLNVGFLLQLVSAEE